MRSSTVLKRDLFPRASVENLLVFWLPSAVITVLFDQTEKFGIGYLKNQPSPFRGSFISGSYLPEKNLFRGGATRPVNSSPLLGTVSTPSPGALRFERVGAKDGSSSTN